MSKQDKTVRVELTMTDVLEIQSALGAVFVQRLELAGNVAKYLEMYGNTIFTELDEKMAKAMERLI